MSMGLERNVQKDLLSRRLSNRPDMEQLQNLGIYKQGSVVSRNLEQGLLQRQLGASLDNRPEMEQLVNQGIYLNATSSQIGLEQDMAKTTSPGGALHTAQLNTLRSLAAWENVDVAEEDPAPGSAAAATEPVSRLAPKPTKSSSDAKG